MFLAGMSGSKSILLSEIYANIYSFWHETYELHYSLNVIHPDEERRIYKITNILDLLNIYPDHLRCLKTEVYWDQSYKGIMFSFDKYDVNDKHSFVDSCLNQSAVMQPDWYCTISHHFTSIRQALWLATGIFTGPVTQHP